jgi:LTXXQ motif family protein
VKRMLLSGAIAVAAAVVMPAYAQMPATSPNPQAAPAPISAPEQPSAGAPEGGGGWGMHRMEGAMGRWPMMRQMMMRGMMMRGNPQQHCIDRLARRAARRAYVETELDLTPAQRPLWDKLQSIAQGEQQKERQLCEHLKAPGDMTMLDRMDQAQQFLSSRLDALQAAKPAVQALYQSLSPEQREIFDHPFRRG